MQEQIKSAPRYWTPKENAALKRLYPNTPTAKIAKRLNRTEASVVGHASYLKLERSVEYWEKLKAEQAARVRATNPSKGRHWTPDEIAFILANPTLSRSELATHFETTPGRVYIIVSALRRQGVLPPAVAKSGPKPKEKIAKPVKKPVIKVVSRKLPPAKVEPPKKEPYNRDAGRIRVQVDARTWKYMLPEAAAKFSQYAV